MDSKRTNLSTGLMTRCRNWGLLSVRGYADGKKNESLYFSTRGIEADPEAQAIAKMAECAFAQWAGLDPILAVDWSWHPDNGADVQYYDLSIDVKHTKFGRFLMWPGNKVTSFNRKQFDIFALVTGEGPGFYIRGGTTKIDFLRRHHVAGPGHKLDAGDWYLDRDELFDVMELIETHRGNILYG